jgi:hypothetical protein
MILIGRNVLADYHIYREGNSLLFSTRLEMVFEGGLEGMDGGIDLDKGCFEKLRAWLAAAVGVRSLSLGSRRDVLLCEVTAHEGARNAQRHRTTFLSR